MYRTVVIVQARMGSSRLPGKVMKDLCGKPMVSHVLDRASLIVGVDEVVLATSIESNDDVLAQWVSSNTDFTVVRGSEGDVLGRYQRAANESEADIVVRVTADCPLLSPEVSGRVLKAILDSDGSIDYASNTLSRTWPRGLDTEAFTRESLDRAARESTEPTDREHVTPYIWRHPNKFRLLPVNAEHNHSSERWTVDTEEDFLLVEALLTALQADHSTPSFETTLAYLQAHPHLRALNAHVEQKHC